MIDEYYFIYRVYDINERPGYKDNSRLYGWTHNKNILKAFLQQRDNKKYMVFKNDNNDISRLFSENALDDNKMIDYIKLRSTASNDEYIIYITLEELQEAEKRIQRYFEDLASLKNLDIKDNKDIVYYINMILNLKDEYINALETIGYHPKEIDILYDSVDDNSSINEEIDTAYLFNDNIREHPFGVTGVDSISKKIIYSLESFIKILKDDL